MTWFDNVLRWVSQKGNLLGAIVLVFLMVLITANVMFRLAGSTIVATYDLVELMIVVVIAFALPYAAYEGAHATVTILTSRLSERWRAIFRAVTALAGFSFCAVLTWRTILLTMVNARLGEVTEVTGISVIPFRWIWISGLCLLCLILLRDIVNAVYRGIRK